MAELKQNSDFDAEQMNEDIEAGEMKRPEVNVESDYEKSKEYAVSDIDRSDAGSDAAQQATSPKMTMPDASSETKSEPGSTSNPDDYRDMAKEVNRQI